MLTLCEGCHGKIHGRTFRRHRELQRIGIDRAMAEGKFKGQPADLHKQGEVILLRIMGLGATEIAKRVGFKRGNVYKVMARGIAAGVARRLRIPVP